MINLPIFGSQYRPILQGRFFDLIPALMRELGLRCLIRIILDSKDSKIDRYEDSYINSSAWSVTIVIDQQNSLLYTDTLLTQ